MSLMAGVAVICADAAVGLYNRFHAFPFGIYGAAKVGKTTMHHQLRTRGEVPEIKKRTEGLQRASRKMVKIDGDVRTLKAADVGGQSQYWHEWAKDLKNRKVQYVIFMIDDRHLAQTYNLEHMLAWQFLVDLIVDDYWRMGRKSKKKKHFPKAVGIWANKYDEWGKKYEYNGPIEKHPIFEPFRHGMQRLNDKGIPTYKYIVSAKSDSEMVYRGIMTMISDY